MSYSSYGVNRSTIGASFVFLWMALQMAWLEISSMLPLNQFLILIDEQRGRIYWSISKSVVHCSFFQICSLYRHVCNNNFVMVTARQKLPSFNVVLCGSGITDFPDSYIFEGNDRGFRFFCGGCPT